MQGPAVFAAFDQYEGVFDNATQVVKILAGAAGFLVTIWFYIRYLRGERHFDLRGEVLAVAMNANGSFHAITQAITEAPLARAFHPWMERGMRRVAIMSIKKGNRFLVLRNRDLTKAMLVTLKGIFLEKLGATSIGIAMNPPIRGRRIVRAYIAVRQDDWPLAEDRFQTIRYMIFFDWQVERTIDNPRWVMTRKEMMALPESERPVNWEIGYQDDKADHLRWVAEAVAKARETAPNASDLEDRPLDLEHAGIMEFRFMTSNDAPGTGFAELLQA